MNLPALEIIEPGMFTTVQDRGRYGYQRFGVPVSGAMDEFALRAANLLVGNDQGAAGLEITVVGPCIRFTANTWIAVTGADLSPRLDGLPLPRWQTVEVRDGSMLSFYKRRDGMRAYLAVAGGIGVPMVMGSRSTYLKSAIGGFQGRAIRKGDVIPTLPSRLGDRFVKRRLPHGSEAPTYGGYHEIRFIVGPQHKAFRAEAIMTLLDSMYVISLNSDRMGYKLDGPKIMHRTVPDIVSDGNPLGAIQVPGDGVPIILLADRGTTGGYTKIATVISADIGTVAQAAPGQSVTFRAVTVEDAHQVFREREAILSDIAGGVPTHPGLSTGRSILVDGEAFEVANEDGETLSHPQVTGEALLNRTHLARATVQGHTYEFRVEVRRDESQQE